MEIRKMCEIVEYFTPGIMIIYLEDKKKELLLLAITILLISASILDNSKITIYVLYIFVLYFLRKFISNTFINLKYDKVNLFNLLMLLIFIYVFIVNPNTRSVDTYSSLDYKFILLIFISNSISVLLCIGLSFMGLGIPFVLMIEYRFAVSILSNSTNLIAYNLAVIPHGIIEFYVMYYVFELSLNILHDYKNMLSVKEYKMIVNLKKLILYEVPKLLFLLLLASIIEVLLSNKLYILLINL
ncbi:stage II sporulation protein M [Clostridium senegalense]|uniref:stage II sporulation protein M n=1 Tax=Clostridium senegalense TaxID=1465809 RepID=UPI001C102165|nr:stage II sporulation protein M [Clostridium senegalense]MBU5228160.1 stage II sporulation protein M [Clostridium senegalense]